MRLSAEAMNAALADLHALQYRANVKAAYEAFLAAKWVEGDHGEGGAPTFNGSIAAVEELFVLAPDNLVGRLSPFRWLWQVTENSGRKTIWLQNSRGGEKLSKRLFVNGHIENGLKPTAVEELLAVLPVSEGGVTKLPKRQALAALVLRDEQFDGGATWAVADEQLKARLNLSDAQLGLITNPDSLGVDLFGDPEWSLATLDPDFAPPEAATILPIAAATHGVTEAIEIAVVIDGRLERMLRLAIRSYKSIMLVGPPGTGKDTILRWLIEQVRADPMSLGFEPQFDPDPMWKTPDESWSAFNIIGGLAPDKDGALTWSPGLLLNALAENRWLILDEANRGDMDKIMGPLLTWLSEHEVEIGRTKAHNGKPITIGWSSVDAVSSIAEVADSQRYLAGTAFRLIGTYNPQDAQRVFRFGQALSRRFVVVPVPALEPGQFEQLLSDRFPALLSPAVQALVGLYSAHQVDTPTMLGPALFLGMARYVSAGIPVATEAQTVAEDEAEDTLLAQLLAEAYVLATARYLAGYDDRVVEALGRRIVDDESVLTESQWKWVMSQRGVVS